MLAFALSLVSSVPQLLTSLRRPTDQPSSLSVSAWVMRCASQASWLFYAIVVHDLPVTVSAVFILTSAVLILAVETRRRATTPSTCSSTAVAVPAQVT
jgi:uncharacterized protein with PQ loop repeat